MSRHQFIKNLDFDDELDDFDGGDYDEYDGAYGAGMPQSICVLLDCHIQTLANSKVRIKRIERGRPRTNATRNYKS